MTRQLLLLAGTTILIWVSADLSRLLTIPDAANTSAVWPPLGIALAAAWAFGRQWLAVYPVIIGAWFAVHGYSPTIVLLFMAEQGTELLLMVWLHRRFVRESVILATLGGALRFYGFVPVLALLLPSGLLALSYHQFGYFQDLPVIAVWLFQWLPEALGVVLFAPALQRILIWARGKERFGGSAWTTLFILLFVVILAASLGSAAFDKYNYARGFDYLFFPLLIAIALAGYVRTALITLPLAVICTILGVYLGTWATDQQAWNALGEAITFGGVLAIMTQLVMATTVERTGLIGSLREASRRDTVTGELNRHGLVEQVTTADPFPGPNTVCVTLYLRDFIYARELLPKQLAVHCECWILDNIRQQLEPSARWFALARLEKGVYSAIVACDNIPTLRGHLQQLIDRVRGETFRASDWTYQIDATVGALPFQASDSVEDVITASRYKALEIEKISSTPVHFDENYQNLLTVRRQELQQLERLKHALKQDRFVLFGQEIRPIDSSGRMRSKVELLIRMVDDDGQPVSPGQFMPAANHFGYMPDVDRWVVHQAITEIASRPELANHFDQFSINLSGASLSQPDTGHRIARELNDSGLSPSLFCFEITETEAIDDWDIALANLETLKQTGFAVSLDDFGTGLATFEYLNKFDFDIVKIDGAFVRHLDTETANTDVVEAIVLVARQRAMHTVAEFVENTVIADRLRELDVDYMQGFGLHRPTPLGEIGH